MLQLVNQITKRSDLTYRKILEKMDKDAEALIVRQTILDRDFDVLPPWFKRFKDDLSVKIGLVYQGDRLLIPKSLRGCCKSFTVTTQEKAK